MTIEVNPLSVPWTRILFPLILNGVLENVLVCAQLSSKLVHGTKNNALSHSYLDFWGYLINFSFLCPHCPLGALIWRDMQIT